MEEWIKIYSFESQYQAEMIKGILEQNDVRAVIINAKDSLFLIGELELYVNGSDEKKALAIIDEYKGLTKIDSFIMRGPIERLKDILEDNGIFSVIKVAKNARYVLDNYELYVENKDVEAALPFLTGAKLEGWKCIDTCTKTTQARFRIEILNQHHIPSIVIKKRDAKYMKTELNIYVPATEENASQILQQPEGWSLLMENIESRSIAEITEKLLGKNGIRALIFGQGPFCIMVESDEVEASHQVLNENRKWKLAETYTDKIEADYAVALLENAGVEAIAVVKNEISLMVEIEVYVEEFQLDNAASILKTLTLAEEDE